MAEKRFEVELPEEVLLGFGWEEGEVPRRVREALLMNAIREARRCVYDPVCRDHEGNCHACTHLAETSCRFFNLNLSRSFLFGGPDSELARIPVGYFDSSFA